MPKASKPQTTSKPQMPGLNLLGFMLASVGVIFLAEVAPPFGVGTMTLILLYEVMTHPSNAQTLANYLKGGK